MIVINACVQNTNFATINCIVNRRAEISGDVKMLYGRCNIQLRRSRAGFRCNAMFILRYLAVGWKSKRTLFLWQKDVAGLFVENRNHGLA